MRSWMVHRFLLHTTATAKSSSTTTTSGRTALRKRPRKSSSYVSTCVSCRCFWQLPQKVLPLEKSHRRRNSGSSPAPIIVGSSSSSASATRFSRVVGWQGTIVRLGSDLSVFSTQSSLQSIKESTQGVVARPPTILSPPNWGIGVVGFRRQPRIDPWHRHKPSHDDRSHGNHNHHHHHHHHPDMVHHRGVAFQLYSSKSDAANAADAGLDEEEDGGGSCSCSSSSKRTKNKNNKIQFESWWRETESLLQQYQTYHHQPDETTPCSANESFRQRLGADLRNDGADPTTATTLVEAAMKMIRCGTRFRTPEALRRCWELWDVVLESIPLSSMLWQYTHGNHPQLTHVLNALVDSWRIVWEQQFVVLQRNKQDPKSRGRKERHNDTAQQRLDPTTTRDPNKIASREDGGEYDTSSTSTTTAKVRVVESPLELMHRLQQPPTSQWIDRRTCTILLSAFGHYPLHYQHERHNAPLYCERLLSYMIHHRSSLDDLAPSETDDGGSEDERRHSDVISSTPSKLSPDTVAWTSVLQAWARSGRNDAPQRALELWAHWHEWVHRQQDAFFASDLEHEPNLISYNTLLDALCSSHQMQWLQVAEELLHQMMQEHHHGDSTRLHLPGLWPSPPPAPNHVSFQLMIQGYVRSGQLSITLPWLQQMVECHQGHVDIFSNVLSAAVKKRQFDLAEQVYQMYQDAATAASALDPSPDTRSTGAIVSSQHQDAHNLAPSPYLSRALLIWYAHTQRPEQAELELNRLELWPDGDGVGYATFGHYGDVLQAWVTHPAANPHELADRCERILWRMVRVAQQRDQARRTEQRHVDAVLRLWAKAAAGRGVSNAALARSNASRSESEAGNGMRPEERAEELLQSLRIQSGVPVGASSYHKVMQAYVDSNHPDAARRVTALLHKLERDPVLQPTRFHYTAAIQAWMRHANADRASVEAQLERITEAALAQVQEGNLDAKPDATLLGTMLHAFARLGNGPSAERVFNLLCQMSSTQGNGRCALTVREMNLVLLSWLRSNDAAALRNARSVVLRMEQDRGIAPNERTRQLLKELHSRQQKSASRNDKRSTSSKATAHLTPTLRH